jgi:hypothetical protein
MKPSSLTYLLLAAAILLPGVASAQRTIRSDNPGQYCDAFKWGNLSQDPYVPLNGNSDALKDLATFFDPGTVTTGDTIVACAPRATLATVWADASDQAPNPASKPDPDTNVPTIAALTAKGAVMYAWSNNSSAVKFAHAPDVEVIVWTLRASQILPEPAFEVELDNWCGLSPYFTNGSQSQVPPNATSSITWNGNVYTASCASFTTPNSTSATDLLLNSSGVLLGYIDASNTRHVTGKAPGWTLGLLTTTALAVSPDPATADSPVAIQGAVAGLPGGPAPTGTIKFYNNGTTELGSGTLNSAGIAVFNATTLGTGNYSVTATYSGDANHAGSTSPAQALTVN